MSDENFEEESLISQDDIDKLLDASSIEEAEENLKQEPEPVEDELGELSQDDIDSLMSGGVSDTADEEASSEADGEDPGDEPGELSQEDIDRMMNAGTAQNEPEPDESDDTAGDGGELSQEDIDRMMNADSSESEDEDEEMELISQEDIQRLMNSSTEDSDSDSESGPEDSQDSEDEADDLELISQEDINDLMTDNAGADSDPVDSQEESGIEMVDIEDDFIIEESEAVDVAAALIAQETIDELIRKGPEPDPEEEPEEEPVALGAEAEPSETVVLDDEPEPDSIEPEPAPAEETEELSEIGRTDVEEPGLDEQDLNEVTQEDIDSLLQGSDEDDDFLEDEEDILISQDDIDTLLMAADQEDEDVLGDLLDDGETLDEFDTEDILDGEEEDNDQVVLEGTEEITRESEEEPENTKSPWFKSRLVIAGVSALLVLGISVPTAYFLFFTKGPAQVPDKQPVPVAVYDPVKEPEVASVTIDVNQLSVIKKSGSIVLTDFLILTSGNSSGMAYVQADISIDYSDQRAYHEINDNMPFYRDLIFESIQKNLVTEKENKVTKSDLIWEVENTLKKVLPPQYIDRVSFKTFKTS